MRGLLLVVLLFNCSPTLHKHSSIPDKTMRLPSVDRCELLNSFANENIVVVITKNCFATNHTFIAVTFKVESYDIAGEEAANVIVRLLKYKPILAPILKTHLLSSDQKETMPMMLFVVMGKQ